MNAISRSAKFASLTLLLTFLADTAIAQPAEVWVDDDWFGCLPGQAVDGHVCGQDAFGSIQNGIDGVSENGAVNIAPGIYVENLFITKNGLSLRGSGAVITKVDGGSNGSVLSVNATLAGPYVSGLMLSNGSGNWIGGYTYGGAILVENGKLTLSDSVIASNQSSDGAGGIEARDSEIELYRNRFSDNSGWWGGAISLRRTEAVIAQNVIELSYCGYGGTVWLDDSSIAVLTNNQITRNPCYAPAIGIGPAATATIMNNTIADNGGPGIATGTYYTNGGTGFAEITNNIIWGNQQPLVNLTATYSDTDAADPGEGNISGDPAFIDRANGDFQVALFSPVIDAGTDIGVPAHDLVGIPRTADGDNDGIARTDIGAFEVMGPFCDVAPMYWAADFIETLSNSGITAGCGNDDYCPEQQVTRAQMAVFLERGMHGANYQPPPASGSLFLDVAATDFAAAFIEQLSADGITSGCGSGIYCPNDSVTRAQMAVFLLRARYGASYTPPEPTGVFNDVPVGSFADAWIEQLAAEGITSGCGNGNYCPDNPVTRAQMAVFLVRTFGL
jgi:hypothetical protein